MNSDLITGLSWVPVVTYTPNDDYGSSIASPGMELLRIRDRSTDKGSILHWVEVTFYSFRSENNFNRILVDLTHHLEIWAFKPRIYDWYGFKIPENITRMKAIYDKDILLVEKPLCTKCWVNV